MSDKNKAIDPGTWLHSAGAVRAAQAAASSQSIEDYLERIQELIETKGYARPVDIAQALGIRQSSVTKMMQRLHTLGHANYEKHRGLTLTPSGKKLALRIRRRHKIVSEFLRLLGVDEPSLQEDTEGIEHHVSPQTMEKLENLVSFFADNEAILAQYRNHRAS